MPVLLVTCPGEREPAKRLSKGLRAPPHRWGWWSGSAKDELGKPKALGPTQKRAEKR